MTRCLAPLLAVLGLTVVPLAAQAPAAGNGTIFVGSYSGHLTAVDEATEKFTKIPLQTGPPFVVRLSPDKTRFYVQSANQERFEVVDVASRKSVDAFTLSDARKHVRAMAFEVDPQHRTMVIVAKTATKQIDRWEIGAPEFILYDLAAHKVTRTVPWTIDPEPGITAPRSASLPTASCSTCSATRSPSSTPPRWSKWSLGTWRCRSTRR